MVVSLASWTSSKQLERLVSESSTRWRWRLLCLSGSTRNGRLRGGTDVPAKRLTGLVNVETPKVKHLCCCPTTCRLPSFLLTIVKISCNHTSGQCFFLVLMANHINYSSGCRTARPLTTSSKLWKQISLVAPFSLWEFWRPDKMTET